MIMWDCIIVGGGAAGLWAGGTAAERGRKTMVLEKNNKAGVKILMSGGRGATSRITAQREKSPKLLDPMADFFFRH